LTWRDPKIINDMKRIFTTTAAVIFSVILYAQDMQYSQFYAASLYLNPAMAGANSCSRLATNYRNQWHQIPGAFTSYIVSYDHCLPAKNFGFGVMVNNDRAGTGKLGATSASLIYAYQLNMSRKLTVSTGFQATYTSRSVNFYDLTFVDQLVTGSNTTVEIPLYEKVRYFDMSTGLVAYTRRFWFGFSAHHLNTPNQAMVMENSKLPVKYSIHTGWQLPMGRGDKAMKEINRRNFTPAINYKHQGKYDQLDIGFSGQYSPIMLGLWYRGIPVKKYSEDVRSTDAIVFIAGFIYERFNFGYSYDITISKLASSTGGSHELSMAYQFCDAAALRKKRKVQKFIPCPKF
jgi:type IX secretion system PorP/SprF family membrane protein